MHSLGRQKATMNIAKTIVLWSLMPTLITLGCVCQVEVHKSQMMHAAHLLEKHEQDVTWIILGQYQNDKLVRSELASCQKGSEAFDLLTSCGTAVRDPFPYLCSQLASDYYQSGKKVCFELAERCRHTWCEGLLHDGKFPSDCAFAEIPSGWLFPPKCAEKKH